MTSENEIAPSATTAPEKNRSKQNAMRDPLTGQVTVMTEEDRLAHDEFSNAIINDLAPNGAMEIQLAQRVAADSWRLNRLTAIEDNIFALGFNQFGGEQCLDHVQIDAALAAARVFMQDAKQLQLITMQEQRINRAIQKNLALLQSLQAIRKAEANLPQPAAAPQEQVVPAVTPPAIHQNPTPNGFVLSNPEIDPATGSVPNCPPNQKSRHLPARAA